MRPIVNREGEKYYRLTIIKELGGGNVLCRCDCGNELVTRKSAVLNGSKRSCGCLTIDRSAELLSKSARVGGKAYIKRLVSKYIPNRNTSGTKGVWWDKRREKWVAEICYDGKRHFLGRFSEKEDAIEARRKAEDVYFAPAIEEYESKPLDTSLLGKKFYRWTVIDIRQSKINGIECFCQCECGTKKWIRLNILQKGLSKSCGCLKKEPQNYQVSLR
jgi:hypothetical protein